MKYLDLTIGLEKSSITDFFFYLVYTVNADPPQNRIIGINGLSDYFS